MSKPNRKATQKMISIFPAHQAMIDRLILVKGIASASEVFRQALVLFYDDTFKYYADTAKKQILETQKIKETEFKFFPNDSFAEEKGAFLAKNLNGEDVAVFADAGNNFKVVPLDKVKEAWADKDSFLEIRHRDQLSSWGIATPAELKNEFLKRFQNPDGTNVYGVVLPNPTEPVL